MSNLSAFDPQSFLDATMDAPLERRAPLPVQDYVGIIGEVTARRWTTDKETATTKEGIAWDVPIELQVPQALQEAMQLPPTIKLKDGIMLELTTNGAIDQSKGKNGKLRMYREAVDLNKPGDTFSARKLQGRLVTVKIKHREYPEGTGQIVEDVQSVAKPA